MKKQFTIRHGEDGVFIDNVLSEFAHPQEISEALVQLKATYDEQDRLLRQAKRNPLARQRGEPTSVTTGPTTPPAPVTSPSLHDSRRTYQGLATSCSPTFGPRLDQAGSQIRGGGQGAGGLPGSSGPWRVPTAQTLLAPGPLPAPLRPWLLRGQ
jgi:hypothetical protein